MCSIQPRYVSIDGPDDNFPKQVFGDIAAERNTNIKGPGVQNEINLSRRNLIPVNNPMGDAVISNPLRNGEICVGINDWKKTFGMGVGHELANVRPRIGAQRGDPRGIASIRGIWTDTPAYSGKSYTGRYLVNRLK